MKFRNLIAALCLTLIVAASAAPTQANAQSISGIRDAISSLQAVAGNSCLSPVGFSFSKCIFNPLAIATSNLLISFGGWILELTGSIFDFAVNKVIIDFKTTLQSLGLISAGGGTGLIESGWTFFRDLSNIMLIGIFVFIAISLILGLKEYGQKRLIARVLIIAVLMNFSLLFTKIVIDASNFTAFAIYKQTAGAGGDGQVHVAESLLKPMKILGVWDTTKLQDLVSSSPDGGAFIAFSYGIVAFIILVALAIVIGYGAFLVLARAVLFIFLMVTAPIAYVSYLAPHFEEGQFGWNNWWRSLINNAAFAPLLMMFLAVTFMLVRIAGPSATVPLGQTLATPDTAAISAGWKALLLYFIGTGLLYTSLRLSSSLAGSISGIKLGQMATALPFTLGGALAARGLQYTAGKGFAKASDNKAAQLQAARMQALQSGKAEDWAAVERLRKQKEMLDKGAKSSFNMFNTKLGKAAAGSTGLAGVLAGQTKGNFKDDMHARGEAALDKAKQTQVTDKDKDAMRKKVAEETAAANQAKLEEAKTNLEAAKADLEKAKAENETVNGPDKARLEAAADQQVTQNKIDRAPDMDAATREVKVIEKEKSDVVAGHNNEIQKMAAAAEKMSGEVRDKQLRDMEQKKAEHAQAIKAIDHRITQARDKVRTIDSEIVAPKAALIQRQRAAADTMRERQAKVDTLERQMPLLEKAAKLDVDDLKNSKQVKADAGKLIRTAESNAKTQQGRIAEETAGWLGGSAGAHEVQHVFDDKLKNKTKAESAFDALQNALKENKSEGGEAAGGEHA